MADSSFDIVNKIDRQEVDNALNQAAKELSQRFDFKNTGAKIEWKGELAVEITADTEERASAALDVFRDKLVKRQISLKSLEAGEPQLSGQELQDRAAACRPGISQEQAKKLGKLIRDEGPKSVKAQVMGDELRVTLEEPRRPAGRAGPGARTPTWTSPSSSSTTADRRQARSRLVARRGPGSSTTPRRVERLTGRHGRLPAGEAVALVDESVGRGGGVLRDGRPVQGVERADLDADPAVHAQRRSRSRSGRGRPRCAGGGARRRPGSVSVWESISMHQSGHSRTQSMQTVQLSSTSAMTPRVRGGGALGRHDRRLGPVGGTPGGSVRRRARPTGVATGPSRPATAGRRERRARSPCAAGRAPNAGRQQQRRRAGRGR